MGLRSEIREELESEEFKKSEQAIIDRYYNNLKPDYEIHGIIWAHLHDTFMDDELSPRDRKMMDLELKLNRLRHGID